MFAGAGAETWCMDAWSDGVAGASCLGPTPRRLPRSVIDDNLVPDVPRPQQVCWFAALAHFPGVRAIPAVDPKRPRPPSPDVVGRVGPMSGGVSTGGHGGCE